MNGNACRHTAPDAAQGQEAGGRKRKGPHHGVRYGCSAKRNGSNLTETYDDRDCVPRTLVLLMSGTYVYTLTHVGREERFRSIQPPYGAPPFMLQAPGPG